MAYCVAADVYLQAPQIGSGASPLDVDGYIEQADGVIDARLRGMFEVPFTSPDLIIKRISSMLAAAFALRAYYSQATTDEPSVYAKSIEDDAMKMIEGIKVDPSLISQRVRQTSTAEDEDSRGFYLHGGLGTILRGDDA